MNRMFDRTAGASQAIAWYWKLLPALLVAALLAALVVAGLSEAPRGTSPSLSAEIDPAPAVPDPAPSGTTVAADRHGTRQP